jgi:hypothetical protein
LPSSTAKRVVLYRFDRLPQEAIVNPAAYLLERGIEVITTMGSLQLAPYGDVKALCFATESDRGDLFLVHNLFERRPKVPGLWTRFTFRDGARLDGILPHNLLDWPERGYLVIPPRAGAARQRVFLPREALTATELRGVVGVSGSARSELAAKKLQDVQIKMFDQ